MSDDTTTWLKKNPAMNPLRRSLKTSLRFHCPAPDMNASIISNPDKVKDQGLFIPRMLQRPNMQLRKSRAHEFKVPEMISTKPVGKKKENASSASGAKAKKIPTPNQSRKSLLPVPRTKGPEKSSAQGNLPRPSFLPGVSGRRTMARREMIKKMVELSEMKRNEDLETSSQQKLMSNDSSVLRSILKKRRASLRRVSQISETKPKAAKKVLFDGFETSFADDKENDANLSLVESIRKDLNDFTALDEPTVFLNLKNEESSFEEVRQDPPASAWSVEPDERQKTIDRTAMDKIIQVWTSYKENLECLQGIRNSLEDSFESFLQHSLLMKKKYVEYKKNSDEIYDKLSKLGEELEENMRKVLEDAPGPATPASGRKATGRKSSERSGKIKMSDRSKGIKKNSGKKCVPALKRDLLKDVDDNFSLVSKKSFLQA